jgi:hypothetical protein
MSTFYCCTCNTHRAEEHKVMWMKSTKPRCTFCMERVAKTLRLSETARHDRRKRNSSKPIWIPETP